MTAAIELLPKRERLCSRDCCSEANAIVMNVSGERDVTELAHATHPKVLLTA